MIFLTVGTQLPFDRLARAVDEWAGANTDTGVFGQIGNPDRNGYLPHNFNWRANLTPTEFDDAVGNCSLIVAHAGMGSILSALRSRKPIIVLPRLAAMGEHRSDHQVATAKRMGGRRGVHVAWEEDALAPLIDRVLDGGFHEEFEPMEKFADPGLIEALRRQIITA